VVLNLWSAFPQFIARAGTFRHVSRGAIEAWAGASLKTLPFAASILLENVVRNAGRIADPAAAIRAVAGMGRGGGAESIHVFPSRMVMPDSSAVPLLVDLAALRDAAGRNEIPPASINPAIPVDLIIDHSVSADVAMQPDAAACNEQLEYQRNGERYRFLRWAEQAFSNLRVVPPGIGIIHQLNMECLSDVVVRSGDAEPPLVHPEFVVGIDSHTPMIGGLGVLGLGVGGIEGMGILLGDGMTLPVPGIVGCRLTGRLPPGTAATDLALTLTERLRKFGISNRLVEFHGPGLTFLTVPDRATIANMAPEYGALTAFFPIDAEVLAYLAAVGKSQRHIENVEAYARMMDLWHIPEAAPKTYDAVIELDLSEIKLTVSGPTRPDQKLLLAEVPASVSRETLPLASTDADTPADGFVALAAITSCTNSANPAALVTAALLARNAYRRGLRRQPWVKASFSPGSPNIADFLRRLGLQEAFDALGFHVAGYGCMTCIGNSGALLEPAERAIVADQVIPAAVLSGNRNFPGRIHPMIQSAYLCSPALVVAYALAGNMRVNLESEPIGRASDGGPVHLADLWPDAAEVESFLRQSAYAVTAGQVALPVPPRWRDLDHATGPLFPWDESSEMIRCPPFFALPETAPAFQPIHHARPLLLLGDQVSTDEISPAGDIDIRSPAARYLLDRGVAAPDIGTYISRRGNHEVMLRGTFANPRLRNQLCPEQAGWYTRLMPDGVTMPIHEAVAAYHRRNVQTVIVAGRNYGCGSSRDWAAKGTRLLGIRAVIARSFERIHRENLVGMGVLPLMLPVDGSLPMDGTEVFSLPELVSVPAPGQQCDLLVEAPGRAPVRLPVSACIATSREAERLAAGGNYLHRAAAFRHASNLSGA